LFGRVVSVAPDTKHPARRARHMLDDGRDALRTEAQGPIDQSGQKLSSIIRSNDHGQTVGKVAAPRPVSRRAPMTASL